MRTTHSLPYGGRGGGIHDRDLPPTETHPCEQNHKM